MQFSPISCHFNHLRCKYSPQHPVLKHASVYVPPLMSETKFHVHTNNRNMYSKSYPCNRPWRPMGLWDVQDPTLSRQSVRLSILHTGCTLHTGGFLVLISIRGWVNPRTIERLGRLGKLKTKKLNDLVRNRSRDLSAWSIVPLPTTPHKSILLKFIHWSMLTKYVVRNSCSKLILC
jgi:hypothetical protein